MSESENAGAGQSQTVEQLLHAVLASNLSDLTVGADGNKLVLSCIDKAILLSLIAEAWWHSDVGGARTTPRALGQQWSVDEQTVRRSLKKLTTVQLLVTQPTGKYTHFRVNTAAINERISAPVAR